jgi:DNA replicative helicase MCM subunit Mcm2 (Cdc46/Mcm family)
MRGQIMSLFDLIFEDIEDEEHKDDCSPQRNILDIKIGNHMDDPHSFRGVWLKQNVNI